MCLKLLTRVTTAQIIITKVNKSLYVTIGIAPFARLEQMETVPRLPWYVYYYQCAGMSISDTPLKCRNFGTYYQQGKSPDCPENHDGVFERQPFGGGTETHLALSSYVIRTISLTTKSL